MTQQHKKTTFSMKKKMANPGVRFFWTFNQKRRIKLPNFYSRDINQIQDHSQQYQRTICAIKSNERQPISRRAQAVSKGSPRCPIRASNFAGLVAHKTLTNFFAFLGFHLLLIL
jgi:hypothetical protein